jgi:Flp pilus assembly protein protease CpaA
MFEVIFLWALGFIWILFAMIQDIRNREIADWLNFSLVIFALGFRFFYSLFELQGMSLFYSGLIGFGIFLILGNLFYYSKMFAGGDAKLFMALGAILPFSNNLFNNLEGFFYFIFIFLIVGAIYGIFFSLWLGFSNFRKFRKQFTKEFKKNKIFVYGGVIFFLVFFIFGVLYFSSFIYFSILFLFFPFLFLFSKSVDESCMIKKIKTSKLTEGDWLYKDIKIGSKKIKATWNGLSEEEIELLRNKKKFVYVRYGIQFAPVFLISYLVWIAWFLLGFSF